MKRALLVGLALPLLLASCASNDDVPTVITISAAASLSDAFTEIGEAFEQRNPDVTVRFNFAGSSTLAEQINAGAPVDVFAAASNEAMDRASSELEERRSFASNSLAIAVPSGNPAGITSLKDLAQSSVTLVMCDAPVPCGAAALALFDRNDLDITPSSLEPDVRAVLTKVITDEADAGIVYRSDVLAAGDQVESIEIPDSTNVSTTYPIAIVNGASSTARDFMDFVLSEDGQAIVRTWGFGSP